MAGTDVHDLIRRAHHGGFMLDDDDGVARVAEFFQNADEPLGVARMQADAGFVQNEERVDQSCAKARRKIHALGFAAGQRARRTIQREVAEADFVQVGEAGADFTEDGRDGIGA